VLCSRYLLGGVSIERWESMDAMAAVFPGPGAYAGELVSALQAGDCTCYFWNAWYEAWIKELRRQQEHFTVHFGTAMEVCALPQLTCNAALLCTCRHQAAVTLCRQSCQRMPAHLPSAWADPCLEAACWGLQQQHTNPQAWGRTALHWQTASACRTQVMLGVGWVCLDDGITGPASCYVVE
jgi:hypothetical protein